MQKAHDFDILKHKNFNKNWTPEEKFELVSQVIVRKAIQAGINGGLLYQWVRKYKIYGYNGLGNKKKGRKFRSPTMKKRDMQKPRKLEKSEYEELIRLRAENEYIKTKIAVIKKGSP